MSVLAHLEDLVARGAVATNGPASIAGRYRLALGSTVIRAGLGALLTAVALRRFGASRPCRPRLLLQLPLGGALGLVAVGGEAVVDVLEQAADARGVGAEIVAAVARGRAHVDREPSSSRRTRTATSSRKPMIARARHRLDHAVAPRRLRRAIDHDAPLALA